MLLSLFLSFVALLVRHSRHDIDFTSFVVGPDPLYILSAMAAVTSNPPSSGVKSTPNQGGMKQGKAAVPTNHVTTKDGVTVRARIDPTLAVEDVIRQLCFNLKLKDPPAMFSLRDEDEVLVTTENLNKMIKSKANLKCVRAFHEEPARV